MDLFDPRLIEALRRVARVARRLPGGGMIGRPVGRLPAGGTELSGTRDYSPGDDYRQIDWRLCARHDELLTKQFFGQTQLRTHLLIDASGSMGLGTPTKFDVARQIAAALGCAALSSGQQLGVTSFADTVLDDFAVGHFARLLRWLSRLKIEPNATDLSKTATLFARLRRRTNKGLVLVVSDFYDRNFAEGLDLLRHEGWEPRLIQVYDPAEAEPEGLGDFALRDVESGVATAITVTETVRKRYRMLYRQHQRSLGDRGMPVVHVDCTMPLGERLLACVGGRGTGTGGVGTTGLAGTTRYVVREGHLRR